MVLIETDVVLALASNRDKHHNEAVEIVKRIRPLKLSPYTLIELDLLILSGKLKVRVPTFYEGLNKTLSYYGIELIRPSPKHLEGGWELREKYGLTYFDSLHASTAMIEKEVLVSYDRAYSNIEELKYTTPQGALKQYGSIAKS